MAHSKTDSKSSSAIVMRKRFGAWLKTRREEVGITQRDIAAKCGYDYYTMVSQIERGLARVPAEDILTWADLLQVDPKQFGKLVLYWTDPHVYHAVYGVNPLDEQKLPRTNAK